MARDDYDVLIFKILTYLYGCLKRKTVFDLKTFDAVINKRELNDSYLTEVLVRMTEDGYIKNLVYAKAWGNEYVIGSDLKDMQITSEGIHYLKENNRMKNIKDYLLEHPEFITGLIQIVFTATTK